MPMKKDDHEALLGELLDTELTHTRRTEILQNLRADYGSVLAEHQEHSDRITKLSEDNSDLIVSNSKLFRQIGVTGTPKEKDEVKKEFSETITLEQLEKGSAN
jgi:hypothetical protein